MLHSWLTFRSLLTVPALVARDYAALDWDQYHAANAREWLLPYDGLLREKLSHRLDRLSRSDPVLEIGCGTSNLAAELHREGWSSVTAVDLSQQAVAAAQALCGGRPGLQFLVADARDLSAAVAAGSVAAALDKGTLDAICCGDGFDFEARRVAASVVRVLRPGGVWVCVSLMPPAVVLPLMERPEWESLSAEALERTGLHLYTGVLRCS